jgi:hypothetical protein
MNAMRSGNAVWLIPGRKGDRPSLRRDRTGVLTRTVGTIALLAGVAFGFAPVQAPAVSSPQRLDRTLATASAKIEARLPAWAEPRREPSGTIAAARVPDAFVPASLGAQAGFLPAADDFVTGSLKPFRPALSGGAGGWKDREFARIEVVDGRTIAADGLRIRLGGLELPGLDEICRTLDGRLETCAVRAATQLELLTRARKVVCRYRLDTASEGSGACRIGASDLAERMMRTGYTKRIAVAERVGAASGARIAN